MIVYAVSTSSLVNCSSGATAQFKICADLSRLRLDADTYLTQRCAMSVTNTFRYYARLARYQVWRIDALRYSGQRFDCPICAGRFDTMKPFIGACHLRGVLTDHHTENAVCPRCRSDIRQRFILAFMRQRSDLFTRPQRVLHFAPELGLYQLLRKADLDYVTADLHPDQFTKAVRADITDIPFSDGEFDHVICIHVVEHIKNDRLAIRELYRVTKPGGHAIIAVPTYGETTYEDESLDYAGREIQYGTGDHLRLNGLDFANKLEEAGFSVEIVSVDDVPGKYVDRAVRSPHTESDRYLFWCTKIQATLS